MSNQLEIEEAVTSRGVAQAVELLATIIDSSDDALIVTSLDGTILSWNRGAERLYGYSEAEVVNRSVLLIVPPESAADVSAVLARVRGGKRVEVHEAKGVHKDGHLIDVSIGISAVRDDTGHVVAAATIARDMTERVRADQTLRESEERYRAFVTNSSEAIWRFEMAEPIPAGLSVDEQIERIYRHGYLAECNDAMARMYGLSHAEEIVGARPGDFMPPDDEENIEFFRAFIGANYRLTDAETTEQTATGEMRHFCNNMVGILEDGCLRRVWGTQRDITEHKHAEAALHSANQRAITEYERLLDRVASLGQALGTARDLAGVFRAVSEFAHASAPCNGLFISLYDAQKQERRAVFASSDGVEQDVSHLPTMPMSASPHSRAIATGSIVMEDDLQQAVVGQPTYPVGAERDPRLPKSALIVPMAVMGRIIGGVELQSIEPAAFTREHATAMRMAANLAATAIENVRLIEQERESAERLRQASKMEAVGRLAGGVAHDFNNLLTVINGYSDLSLRRIEMHSTLHRNLKEIRKAGERAASLTRQLLAFSRKQVLQPRVLRLNEIVSDMEKMLRRLIGEDVELKTSLAADLRSTEADPGQIEQVILNLAVNARDAMPAGGKLTVTTSNVYLDEQYAARHVAVQPGQYVLLSVSDNGFGMTPEVRKQIFDPFFTTKGPGKGTGLGLSTVYGVVKQSGGNIWVYSEPGHGAIFKIYLPVAESEVEALQRETRETPAAGGVETVLLVEDDNMVRRMTREILEMGGYTVLEAAGGGEAVRACEGYDGAIHLLLTDVVMPQISGKELADVLTLVRPGIKVLFMSGYTDEAIVHHSVLDEGVAFIQKPFTPDSLTRKVREVLDARDGGPGLSG